MRAAATAIPPDTILYSVIFISPLHEVTLPTSSGARFDEGASDAGLVPAEVTESDVEQEGKQGGTGNAKKTPWRRRRDI
jgi:hypothetical protein